MAHITFTSFTRNRLILMLISLIQLCICIANIFRVYYSLSIIVCRFITTIAGVIFADVFILLLMSIAIPFYFSQNHRNTLYWFTTCATISATLLAAVGTAFIYTDYYKTARPILYTSYGIFLVAFSATVWYGFYPLLRTKREKYGDSEPFAVGIWYISILTLVFIIAISLFVWEFTETDSNLRSIAHSATYTFRSVTIVIYAYPPPKPVLPFIQQKIFGAYPIKAVVPSQPASGASVSDCNMTSFTP